MESGTMSTGTDNSLAQLPPENGTVATGRNQKVAQ